MKQLSQREITARAWLFSEGVIRLRVGAADFHLDTTEAADLAAQLLTAVDHAAKR
jgi:hypothetical protein